MRHRSGRTLALFGAITVAAASFATLTGASETSRLAVIGTLKRQPRALYDVLVRPRNAGSRAPASSGLLPPNFLSGTFGGISMEQYSVISHIPGVAVAAPIALVGYVLPQVDVPLRLRRYLGPGQRQLFRERLVWSADRGLSRVRDADSYIYVTAASMQAGTSYAANNPASPGAEESVSSKRSVPVCPYVTLVQPTMSPFSVSLRAQLRAQVLCWSRVTGLDGLTKSPIGFDPGLPTTVSDLGGAVQFPIPLLVAAIDPVAETKLLGLNRAVVSGRYLREGEAPRQLRASGYDQGLALKAAPVLVPTDPYLDESARATINRLSGAAEVLRLPTPAGFYRFLASRRNGRLVLARTVTAAQAYRTFLSEAQHAVELNGYWTAGEVHQPRGPSGVWTPRPVHNPWSVWQIGYTSPPYVDVPMMVADGSFRAVSEYEESLGCPGGCLFPGIHAVGAFDPRRIPGFEDTLKQSLSPFRLPSMTAANPRTARLLRGRSLVPDGNFTGYLAEPPLALTTFAGLQDVFRSTTGPQPMFEGAAPPSAPISSIAVRVAGVRGNGLDSLSRERVRVVAQLIAQRTHLHVDITTGSSYANETIDLPAGHYGRPALQLKTVWTKLGVAVEILNAIDRESVALFALILAVCALFVANASAAMVRARRSEFGILAATGWSSASLFALVLGESAGIGALAGGCGALVSVPVTLALGIHLSLLRLALSGPIAMAVALLGGAWPAISAARTPPSTAIVSPASSRGSAHATNRVWSMAMRNLVRLPLRTALAAFTMAVAVAALTMLLSVLIAFHGSLVGSVLGSAIALQVRWVDTVAVVIMLVLGGVAIADVLFLELRERGGELATLAATGWSEIQLASLIAYEGILIGALGAAAGALAGLIGASLFAGGLSGSVVGVAVLSVAAGIGVSGLAGGAPFWLLRSLPMGELLAEE